MTIPEPIQESQLPPLPEEVAERPQEEEAPEVQPYRLSFVSYKANECEIDSMTADNAKAALKIIRDVGVYFTSQKEFIQNSFVDEVIHVNCEGDYKKLYRGLEEDQEVWEIKYVKERKQIDLRVFFFALESERTFYVLAARTTHYNLDHSR